MADNKSKTKKQLTIWICTAAACLFLGILGAGLYSVLGPNRTYTNLASYLGLTTEDEWAFSVGTSSCENAIKKGDSIYLPLEEVASKISSRFYYDESVKQVIAVTPEGIFTADEISGNLQVVSGKKYISAKFVEDHCPCRVIRTIDKKLISIWADFSSAVSSGMAECDTEMRVKDSIRGEIVSDIAKGEILVRLEEKEEYTYCMTESGLKGYVKTKDIVDNVSDRMVYKGSLREDFAAVSDMDKVCLGWNMIDTFLTQTEQLDDYLKNEKGMNVISPTWFSLADENGNIIDNSDRTYVEKAHSAGLKVWGLVSNFNNEINNLSMLKNKAARDNLIDQLIASALACGLDGINMDFEAIGAGLGGLNADCGVHYLQLLRELTVRAHKEGLVVSVDVPAPYSYNSYFNRAELGKVVDYVIIMAYDEHYAGSEPGSVASYNFVREAVQNTIAEVPAERTILGVPLYTRQWTLDSAGNIIGSRVKLEEELQEDMQTRGATISWLDTEKQYYAEFYNDYGLVKVWVNDTAAMQWKVDMIREFGLAGGAAWRLGAESAATWEVFTSILK